MQAHPPFVSLIMQFLFVRPRLCLRLPSDSQSPTTPLPLANDSYYQAHSGLAPPSYRPCRAHMEKGIPETSEMPEILNVFFPSVAEQVHVVEYLGKRAYLFGRLLQHFVFFLVKV